MIPNVYVIGASRQIVRCRHWIEQLETSGIRVVFDWTKPVEKYGSVGAGLQPSERLFFARQDLKGIDETDLIWFLTPHLDVVTYGAWLELGYAMAAAPVKRRVAGAWSERAKPIVVSPPASDRLIFAGLPQFQEFANDEDAFAFIQGYGG